MQKLSKRNTYTPWSAPQAPCNCDYALNSSEGRNSVHSLKTFDNNSEEDHQQHRAGSEIEKSIQNIVYVLSIGGFPPMLIIKELWV